MADAHARVTRWSARLADPEQERSFRQYNLPVERRKPLALVALLLLAVLASPGVYLLAISDEPPWERLVPLGGAVAVGLLGAMMLLRCRSSRTLQRVAIANVVLLSCAAGIVIATVPDMGVRGAIVLVCGVIVAYLWTPTGFTGSMVLALLYSAITIPAWLYFRDSAEGAEVTIAEQDLAFILAAVGVAHVLSLLESNRLQRERRLLFSQRDTLQQLSAADPLTGLMNRRAFDLTLDRAWKDWMSTQRPLYLLMVDIDHFKLLNDTDGHSAGDRALQGVAAAIVRALPTPRYKTARFGGEEFTCLLPGVGQVGAQVIAESILSEVRRAGIPTSGPNDDGVLTVSVGVAGARLGMRSATELVDAADRQLYRAKRGGRNRVAVEA